VVETETGVDMRHITNRQSPSGATAEPARRWRGRSLLAVVVAGGLLSACGGDTGGDVAAIGAPSSDNETADTRDEIEFGLVSPEEAAALAADPGIIVLDVRTTEGYESGHLADATMIDFYSETFVDDIAALDPDGTYLVYCRSGNRSGQATALMTDLGFEQVYDLDGGILAWDAQGMALTP
jgi:rhodanese-related sulfurtransferase